MAVLPWSLFLLVSLTSDPIFSPICKKKPHILGDLWRRFVHVWVWTWLCVYVLHLFDSFYLTPGTHTQRAVLSLLACRAAYPHLLFLPLCVYSIYLQHPVSSAFFLYLYVLSAVSWQTYSLVTVWASCWFWNCSHPPLLFSLSHSVSSFFPTMSATEAPFSSQLEAVLWKRDDWQTGEGGRQRDEWWCSNQPDTHSTAHNALSLSIITVYEAIAAQLSCKLCSGGEDTILNP